MSSQRGEEHNLYPLFFKNMTGETIPPFGVFRVNGAELQDATAKRTYFKAYKPATNKLEVAHGVNGPVEVPTNKFGHGRQMGRVAEVAYTGTAPVAEQWVKLKAGDWKVERSTTASAGRVWGVDTTNQRVIVEWLGGGDTCVESYLIRPFNHLSDTLSTGTLTITLRLHEGANQSDATLTITPTLTAAVLKAQIDAHAWTDTGCTVTEGPLPNSNLRIKNLPAVNPANDNAVDNVEWIFGGAPTWKSVNGIDVASITVTRCCE